MGRGNPNIRNEGKATRFTSENQPKNKGRKPRLYTIAKEVYKCSYEDYKEGVLYLLQCTLTELKDICDKADTPIWLRNIARALLKDSSTGDMRTTEELITRLWGKPKATVEAEVKTENKTVVSFGNMTAEQFAICLADIKEQEQREQEDE